MKYEMSRFTEDNAARIRKAVSYDVQKEWEDFLVFFTMKSRRWCMIMSSFLTSVWVIWIARQHANTTVLFRFVIQT